MTSIRDRIAGAIHWVAAALLVVSVAVMAVQITLRLFFNAPLTWPEEAVRYSFVWVVYLGSTVAVTRDTHIRVLVAVEPYGTRARFASDVLDWIINVLCFAFLLYWGVDLAYKYKDAEFYTLPGWSQLWYYLALPVPAAVALLFLLMPGRRSAPSTPPGESTL
jgi:TRAP-type C4-dicarboxylate transport system permease small subunit